MGNQPVKMRVDLLDNLLSRQDMPMLRTNGSAGVREQYQLADLISIVNLINTAAVSRFTLGYYIFSIRYRFAGLVNPVVPFREKVLKSNDSLAKYQP